MSMEMTTPFRVGFNGRVSVTTNPDAQVRQHVEVLVATEPGERVMLPGLRCAADVATV
jgi:phage baseplate assembly protein W